MSEGGSAGAGRAEGRAGAGGGGPGRGRRRRRRLPEGGPGSESIPGRERPSGGRPPASPLRFLPGQVPNPAATSPGRMLSTRGLPAGFPTISLPPGRMPLPKDFSPRLSVENVFPPEKPSRNMPPPRSIAAWTPPPREFPPKSSVRTAGREAGWSARSLEDASRCRGCPLQMLIPENQSQNAPQDSIPPKKPPPEDCAPGGCPRAGRPLSPEYPFLQGCSPTGSPPRGTSLLEEVYPPPWRMSLHKDEPQEDPPGSPPQKRPQDTPCTGGGGCCGLIRGSSGRWFASVIPQTVGRTHSCGNRMQSPVFLQ